jgi:bifunctional NMN adenylyltransferase/nudix hydrolase
VSNKQYDYAIFFGRFQPYHNGHHRIVTEAFNVADELIIVIGSHNRPRTIKNPFTSDERKAMISAALTEEQLSRTHFIAQEDYYYSDTKWLESIQKRVQTIQWHKWRPGAIKTTLIGHKKDSSSYYLDMFPQWDFTDVENKLKLNATDLRVEYFKSGFWNTAWYDKVPKETYLYLTQLNRGTVHFDDLMTEYQFIQKYKEAWAAAPYAPTFVTCDATVIQSGHVLLVRRKAAPGKGLWALPGGFLNPGERILDGIIRELGEETKINAPDKVLRGSIVTTRVFDHPERSLRGRTITHNALIHLPNGPLPKVKGSDDAEKAKWVPLGALDSSEFFEDHYDMIQIMKDLIVDRR